MSPPNHLCQTRSLRIMMVARQAVYVLYSPSLPRYTPDYTTPKQNRNNARETLFESPAVVYLSNLSQLDEKDSFGANKECVDKTDPK